MVRHGQTYALVGSVDVRGADIMCSWSGVLPVGAKKIERLRVTYHGSGASRLHRMGMPAEAHVLPHIAPIELRGAMKVSAHGAILEPHDYVYEPRVDSARRLTVTVTAEQVPWGMGIECWALEPGNSTALANALSEPGRGPSLIAVDYVLADWVTPAMLLVVKTAPEEIHAGMAERLRATDPARGEGDPPLIYALVATPGPGLHTDSGLYVPPPLDR